MGVLFRSRGTPFSTGRGVGVRFICEWCHEHVSIVDRQKPFDEVLTHFSDCPRRSGNVTNDQVEGLARHITAIIAAEEKRMRQVS